MSSHKETIDHKIDAIADTAKHTAGKAIDTVADASHRAAEKAAKHAHEVGKQIKDAGEKIMKKADGR